MSSLRAALPKTSQAKSTGGPPWRAKASSSRRAVSESCRIVDTRHNSAEHLEAGVEEVDEQRGDVARRGQQLILVARPLQRAAQGERTARLEAHEVAGGDDADQAAVILQHRQVVHAVGQHGDAGFRRQGVGADGMHRSGGA